MFDSTTPNWSELLCAYLDGELHDTVLLQQLEEQLRTDILLRRELEIAKATKKTLRSRAEKLRTALPENVNQRIREALAQERMSLAQPKPLTLPQKVQLLFAKPIVFIPTSLAAAAIITVVFMVVRRGGSGVPDIPAVEMVAGPLLMNEVAYANFDAVVKGKLTLTQTTADTLELSRFFRENNVKYPVYYPTIQGVLLGGVVSTHNGVAYAHVVYKAQNHLVYIFEADEQSVNGKQLQLSENITRNMAHGRWHWEEKQNLGTLFVWKSNTVVCSAVSDIPTAEFSALFDLEKL